MNKDRENCRILIVEDEILIAADLENRLKGLAYTVCGKATSAEKALELVEKHQPDLVMMDIVLKGNVDGIELAERLRETYGIPVVFLTAYADTDRLERAKLVHPFGYLLKPIQERDLKITVEMALYVAGMDAERRKTEEKLQFQAQLLDSVRESVIATDLDGRITYWGKGAEALYGYSAEEVMGESMGSFFDPDQEKHRRRLEEVFSTGKWNGQYLQYRGNREPFWADVFLSLVKDKNGEPRGFIGIDRDITARRQAEAALRESEGFIRAVMDHLPIGVAVNSVDPIVDFSYMNDNFTRFFRTSREKLADPDSFWDSVYEDPEFREEIRKRVIGDCASGDPERMLWEDVPITRRGEETTYVTARNIPVPGKKIMISTVWDVTERKRAEEEKEKLEAQLRQAQKMEAIGTLAGGISHDFNNLLQAINGYTQIMLFDRFEDDPDYHNLEAILKAGNRAKELVRQLLLFSRNAETQRRPIELSQEVEHARKILERTIPKMIDIETHFGSRLWPILADPIQMEQILLNLGQNAADAMPDKGKLIIEIENMTLDEFYGQTHLNAKPGNYVLLSVSDTGHGMDRETQEHIFEPFFTTKEIGKGTGLGLASVYGIVKSHGGYISCYSEIGRGTTFRLYFPALDQEDVEEETYPDFMPPRGGTETILLVDDDERIRDFASKVLKRFGYSVLTASNGEKALEVYLGKGNEIDLIILDIGMPGMGGYRCLQELIQLNPAAKVLIASGYFFNDQIKKTLEAGAAGYVGKPYQVAFLLEKIRNILDKPE